MVEYYRTHKPRVPNRKLLGRLKNSQRNVSYRELRSLLESYGFVLTRSRGSHRVFGYPGSPIKLTVVESDEVRPVYVRTAIEKIEEAVSL